VEGQRQGQRLSGGGAGPQPPPGSRGEVRIFSDAAELTRAAAEEVVAALGKPGATDPGTFIVPTAMGSARSAPLPTICLSGGSTPKALYRLLADRASPYRDRLAWEAIHFFWGDERHVPPDHPDSNFRMAREAMLDHVPVPAAHVHRIPAEEPDAERAALAYERELIGFFRLQADRDARQSAAIAAPSGSAAAGSSALPGSAAAAAAAPAVDWPRFDLVLLGLGEEGHTASLFPGSPLLAERRRLVAAVWVEQHRTWRITVTPPVLACAATVIFLVSGAAKAAALAAVVAGEPRPDLYPAQLAAPAGGRLLWLVDEAAAAQLRSGR
jgi:6-phosphogluconolactonase